MLRSLLACAVIATASTAQVTYFSAHLEGAQENPPVASPGDGWGVVKFDASTNTVTLNCFHSALTGPATAGHMHQGTVGVNGGVIVGMTQALPGTWVGSGVISAAQATALLNDGMYLNIHTGANPGGEIRGQIVRAKSTRLTAVLSGNQEVPPNGSAATGTAVAFLHEPERRLVYLVESNGLVNVSAAHFHQAPAGSNGPIIVPMTGGNGQYCGVSDHLTAAQATSLLAGGFYANIHTATFPGGEIRGQMQADQGDHWFAVMNGAQENPPVATPGFGGATLTVGANGTISLQGQFTGLTTPATAAHVHIGAVGVNGGIVFGLTIGAGGQLVGSFTPSATDLSNLRAGNWYVNVHTTANPGGEIRGQLGAAVLPSTFGESCAVSTGSKPQAGATGFAAMGGSFSVDLYGSVPNGFAIAIIGLNRDAPLPVALTTVGLNAPGCFALTDVALTFAQFPDGRGCAKQILNVPLDPSLRSVPLVNQWLIFDTVNPAGLVTTNGLAFAVQ
ncbi:MAG: CHRD domain-containing protein [Planctomycetota bacterium]